MGCTVAVEVGKYVGAEVVPPLVGRCVALTRVGLADADVGVTSAVEFDVALLGVAVSVGINRSGTRVAVEVGVGRSGWELAADVK